MASEGTITTIGSDPQAWGVKPVRCDREGDGPNWRLAFNSKQVPSGYAETWERIRHEFEDKYDLEES